jgi:ABC-type phosphate/phosphonate transport system substrate-binding protein
MGTIERIAALPMYDMPELAAAHDALWGWFAQRLSQLGLSGVPASLSRHLSHEDSWRHPGLLLGQGCEYPLATSHAGFARPIATPWYAAEGCEGGYYRSAFVVRAGDCAERLRDLRGRRCVLNDGTSNSGMNLLRAAVAPLAGGAAFFSSVAVSGSHRRSIEMVASGQADLTAVDCVSWAHFRRHGPAQTSMLRVLSWSARSPSLPFITSLATDERSVAALVAVLEGLRSDSTLKAVRQELLLEGAERYRGEDYIDVLRLERHAAALSYGCLR